LPGAKTLRACQDSLLSDSPEPVLRDLIRGAGEGLEYDLDDVIVLRFIHQTSRHLLVPLYLQRPQVRLQPQASRIVETSIALRDPVGATWLPGPRRMLRPVRGKPR
jgi:hypothetical protein